MTEPQLQKHKQHCDMWGCETCKTPSIADRISKPDYIALANDVAAIEDAHNIPADEEREQLYTKLQKIHATYIEAHLEALAKIKPSMARQYELENEVSEIPTKFIWDIVELITATVEAQNKEARDKWKSLCGCPMCEHHTSAYATPQTTVMEKEDI